jgi:large subunit ribosomal protein L21
VPFLENVEVIGKVIGGEKGEKIYISKYKAKVHYRRRMGFRSQNTRILVKKITTGKSERKPEKNISAPRIKKTK